MNHTLALYKDKEHRQLLTRILASCVASIACPVMEMYEGDKFSFVILTGAYVLFPLSFFVLSLSLWIAVAAGQLSRTEAWGWLSVPYSLGFPLAFMAFRLTVVFHAIAPFLLVWFVTSLSSAVWILSTVFCVTVFRGEGVTVPKKVMFGLASFELFISIIWAVSNK